MQKNVRKEIEEFHEFCDKWLGGGIPQESLHENFIAAMDDQFEIITPNGNHANLQVIAAVISSMYGSSGRRVHVRNVQIREFDGFYVATYEEVHTEGDIVTTRLTSSVFVDDPNRTNGVRWVHVHETWLDKGKLVRDKMPETAVAEGKTPIMESLSEDEFRTALQTKLKDEVQRYLDSTMDKKLDELAELLEVVRTLSEIDGYKFDTLVAAADRKKSERGGFDKRLIWKGNE